MASNTSSESYITMDNSHSNMATSDAEKRATTKVAEVAVAETEYPEQETRPAHRLNYAVAVFDGLVAILPVYFVVFAILVYARNNTLASSFTNMAILRMAGFNPTIFPILFTFIVARFIKAVANWKLETGATVGLIQHLLGSRSLVSSMLTPVKLRTSTVLVPLLILMWILNPIGGQTSLRVVSKKSDFVQTNDTFHYLDMNNSVTNVIQAELVEYDFGNTVIDLDFSTALVSPASSKNGTQDLFGNLQIPMLEDLKLHYTADSEGWYSTTAPNFTGLSAKIVDTIAVATNVSHSAPELKYVSLLGIPFIRNGVNPDTTSNNTSTLDKIEQIFGGPDIVSTQYLFNLETSYFHTDCSLQRSKPLQSEVNKYSAFYANLTNWKNTTVVASNNQGLSIAYDSTHSYNSTRPRRIGLESWLAIDNATGEADPYGTSEWEVHLSEAWCNLTTTYVETEVYCQTPSNCTVLRIRESRENHAPSYLSAFDGIFDGFWPNPDNSVENAQFPQQTADWWFKGFVNATGQRGPIALSPLENYFNHPRAPYGATSEPLYNIGAELFSHRFAQLLNTYWLTSIAPYIMTSGVNYTSYQSDMAIGNTPMGSVRTSNGQVYYEHIVLSCHKTYFAILLCISILLTCLGFVTAYLDAIRRGPDVLDDFVNSLRHSPFVHIDQGPTMEDGQDKAKRLRGTVIKMGDVRPEDPVGYVAIGTPNDIQPVERLDYRRHYA